VLEVAILFLGIFATMMPALDYLRLHAGGLLTPTPGLYYWASGTLSSVLDNAPTYLNFLSACEGTYAKPDFILEAQRVLAAGAALDPSTLAGPHAENIRHAIAGLQQSQPALLASGNVTADQIGIGLLIGNPKLNAFIVAVSVGAVFFGANTYIGNGPNFMVKSIAEQQKVNMPTFFGYVFKFTLPFMLPMLVIIWLLFFR
jgi:Na+/H+ antiporter NhaD/arsenite permease-like protein